MTPAEAALEVAEYHYLRYRLSIGDEDSDLEFAIAEAFNRFAQKLEENDEGDIR